MQLFEFGYLMRDPENAQPVSIKKLHTSRFISQMASSICRRLIDRKWRSYADDLETRSRGHLYHRNKASKWSSPIPVCRPFHQYSPEANGAQAPKVKDRLVHQEKV